MLGGGDLVPSCQARLPDLSVDAPSSDLADPYDSGADAPEPSSSSQATNLANVEPEANIHEQASSPSASDNEEYLPPQSKKKGASSSTKQEGKVAAKSSLGQVGAAARWHGKKNFHVLTQNSAWVASRPKLSYADNAGCVNRSGH